MTIHATGHAEIDQQHELLDHLITQLESLCQETAHQVSCLGCSATKRKHCAATLAVTIRELAGVLDGHAAYEEKMMELLPDTPACQEHIAAHKSAHQGIARKMKDFSARISDEPPRELSRLVLHVAGRWLREHSAQFDTRLVRLGIPGVGQIDFDGELVAMLDRHVFPNRPTLARTLSHAEPGRGGELSPRTRFESLSAAQRAVFWLIIEGRTNQHIADTLGVTVNTIKTHRAAVFRKMDVRSALELAKKAGTLK